MIALYILLGLVAVLFLLSLLRIGAWVEYSQQGITARVRVGPVRVQVFPPKKKAPKPPKEKKTKKPKKPKREPENPPPKGGVVDLVFELLPVVLETVGKFGRKLQVDELEILLRVASADPADTAMLYGQANAVLGSLWRPLTQAFHVVDGHARVEAEFQSERMTLYLRAALSLTIGQAVSIGAVFAGKALSAFLRVRREGRQRKAA